MKRYILPLLLFVLLLGVNKSFAQQAKTITGTFNSPHVNVNPKPNGVNVNYSMTISPAKDKLSLASNSSDETVFYVEVLDADNKVVSQWAPSGKGTKFNHDFDIAKLPSGNYHLDMKGANGTIHSVPFTK